MKKYLKFLAVLMILGFVAFAFKTNISKFGPHLSYLLNNSQEDNFVVYIYLNDKGPNAERMLQNPLSLVSQRSLERRLKVKSLNDAVDFTDIPLYEGYVDEISSKVIALRQQIKWFNSISCEVNREQLDEISKFSFVSTIELVEKFYVKHENDEHDFFEQEIINSNQSIALDSLNYGNSLNQITQIKVNLVHNQGIYGQGVLIASLDDGWRNQTHEAFTTLPITVLAQYDFQLHIPGANHTSDSHGTTTLSTVGGYKPGKLIGPSFKAAFIVARTEVDSFERPIEMDNWTAAAQWADSLGADVITSSLGYLGFDAGFPPTYTWVDMNGHTLQVTNAADLAVNKGIVVVNSAGNDGNNVHNTLGGPADGDSVISIGAVNPSGNRSNFSSVGPTTDAPPRIKPDVMAMGESVTTAGISSNTSYSYTSSGTSYSCPLAAGVVGLILSANKDLTPIQVRGILRKFASNSASPNNLMGWGIIDASLSVDSARKLDNTPPVILHTQPFTNTTNNGAITMKAKITDNGIIRNWTNEAPLLYYRKSTNGGVNWTSFAAVNYSAVNLDTFSFAVPGSVNGTTVQYYFAAQDIALPTPKMSTLPAGGSGINPPGTTAPPTRFQYTVGVNGINPVSSEIPEKFALYANYPNPFNPVTKIKFDIAAATNAELVIFDILGRKVASVINEKLSPGKYEISYDAGSLASGVYFYKLVTDNYKDTRKMLLVK